eukprot:2720002-Amphidinium_carterae.1
MACVTVLALFRLTMPRESSWNTRLKMGGAIWIVPLASCCTTSPQLTRQGGQLLHGVMTMSVCQLHCNLERLSSPINISARFERADFSIQLTNMRRSKL